MPQIDTDGTDKYGLVVTVLDTSEQFKHADLTKAIIGIFFEVYNELGYGFLESVYENALALALRERGFEIHQQVAIPVWFRGTRVGVFDADLLVDRSVILELKAVRSFDPAHTAQLLHYLKATDMEVGLLLNFGIKPEFKRVIFDNDRKAATRGSVAVPTVI